MKQNNAEDWETQLETNLMEMEVNNVQRERKEKEKGEEQLTQDE